jgi:hypothetical protein
MALPDKFKVTPGTAIVWGDASGIGVTKTMTFTALATANGREGVYADLGDPWDMDYYVRLGVETGAAPTAGLTAELYLICSHDLSWPAALTGADAAYTVANKLQLGAPVRVVVATNAGNTLMRQAPCIWRPSARYVTPVVINSLGQSLRDTDPDSGNLSRVILVPRISEVVD